MCILETCVHAGNLHACQDNLVSACSYRVTNVRFQLRGQIDSYCALGQVQEMSWVGKLASLGPCFSGNKH